MSNYDYKQEIINSRVGHLGSSDGRLMQQIATAGYVPKSAYERLAVVKGLIEPKNGFVTNAMRFGDIIENEIFDMLSKDKDGKNNYKSNPLWVSKTYNGKNFDLISHPDIVCEDDDTIYVYEVKTTKENWKSTRDTYKGQLYIHYLLAREIANVLGKKVRLFLVCYNTDGLDLTDLNNVGKFDPDRLTISGVKFVTPAFDIRKAIKIIDDFLDDFNEYYGGEDVDADLLPVTIKDEFTNAVTLLREIKKHEAKVEEFKQRLYDFMVEKEIKSIKNDDFSITRVEPTESKTIDYKGFYTYYENVYPRKAKRYAEQFTKNTKRKGYVKITIKENNNND